MIYDFPKATEPIRQGDIFLYLPALHNIDLENFVVYDEQGNQTVANWEKLQDNKEIQTRVIIEPTMAIVASQDCDTTRNDLISFFEIKPFKQILNNELPKKRQSYFRLIMDRPNENPKWYYLPIDKKAGFDEPMAVDFEVMFQIPRKGLETHKKLRMARLKIEALEHYRHLLANYFTRYAYDKWYPLTKKEFEEYNATLPEEEKVDPKPWQK